MENILVTSLNLHEAILVQNTSRVHEILSQNPTEKHFFNINQESALKVATINRFFDIYDILLSFGVGFGRNENLKDIFDNFTTSENEVIRKTNLKFNISYGLNNLLINSSVSYDSTNAQREFEDIKRAYEILGTIPTFSVIMKVVEAFRNFRIIFDFNRDSIMAMDPTARENSHSRLYLEGTIYIAARKMLDPATKFEVLATLARHLCLLAQHIVYKNEANPYFKDDIQSREAMTRITEICNMNREDEFQIYEVFKYKTERQHAELISRVPYLTVMYFNDPERLQVIREYFAELFDYFVERIVSEMETAISWIEPGYERIIFD